MSDKEDRVSVLGRLISLSLDSERVPELFEANEVTPSTASTYLRYAFLALVAANIFMLSGALCFAILYFANS